MKKVMAASLALALLLIVIGVGGCVSDKEAIELTLAHFFPALHPAEQVLVQEWIKAVEEATDGRVKITSYPGETLCKAGEVYGGVIDKIADIGLSCFAYTRGRFPVLEGFELPGIVYENSRVASKVAWELIRELNPEEVQDTRLLMVFATGPGDLFTKAPVRKLSDLQGMSIRATGISAKTLDLLGANPVGMNQSLAYDALSKGMVQGNLAPVEVLQGWKHGEVTRYLTMTPFLYNTLFFITMNLEKWNSLPEDIREAMEKASEKVFEDYAMGLWDQQNESAFKWAVQEKGMEVITLSEEESRVWIELVTPIQDDYISRMDGLGMSGKSILDRIKNLAEKYNDLYRK